MKKGVLLLLTIIATFFVSPAFGDEYTVKGGGIAAVLNDTGSTEKQLQCLNPGINPHALKPGQQIEFINKATLEAALKWCQLQENKYREEYRQDKDANDKDTSDYFGRLASYLNPKKPQISYGDGEGGDIDCQLVLVLAGQYNAYLADQRNKSKGE